MLGKLQELPRRTFLKVTGASVAGAAASGSSAARESADAEAETRVQDDEEFASLIAHRGFAGLYPENTLGAMRGAVAGQSPPTTDRVKADTIEIDVMPSADGNVMAFHDDTLGRLTDAPEGMADQYFWETPTDRLREFRVLGTDERIPTLRETLRTIPSEVGVNVEFKNPGTAEMETGKLDESAVADQRELWMEFTDRALSVAGEFDNEVLISSFGEGALAAVREVDPSVAVGWLFSGSDTIRDGLDVVERYDAEALHPPKSMIAGTSLFDGESFEAVDLVAEADAMGKAVNVWTVGSWYEAEQLQAAGVDGIIADYDGVQRYGAGAV